MAQFEPMKHEIEQSGAQLVYIAAGIILMWIATNIDYHALLTQSWLLYFASVVLLIAVLVIGKRAFGPGADGGRHHRDAGRVRLGDHGRELLGVAELDDDAVPAGRGHGARREKSHDVRTAPCVATASLPGQVEIGGKRDQRTAESRMLTNANVSAGLIQPVMHVE